MTVHDIGRKYGIRFAPENCFFDGDYCPSENSWVDKIVENDRPLKHLIIIRNMGYSYMLDSDIYGNTFPIAFGITSIVEPWFRK